MGIVRDLYIAKKISAGLKLPARSSAALLKRLYLAKHMGAAGDQLTVSGEAPITLTNALARAIHSLTQTGLCAQASTPTPTSPVDIVCNNGVVKASANLLDPTTVEDENKYVSSANGTLGTPSSSGGTFRHSDFIRIVGGEDYYFGQTYYKASAAGIAWYTSADQSTFISGASGTTLGADNMIATAPSNAQYLRFSIRTDENYDTDWEHTVYVCKNGAMSEFHPYGEVYVDGTPEVLTVRGKNLINEAACTLGIYVNPTTGVIEDNSNYYTTEKLYLANGTYTYSQDRSGSGATNDRLNIATYNADDTPIEVVYTGFKREEATVTLSGDYAYVRISYRKTNTDIMLEAGDTATAYQPYFTQTASVENLFAVGSYADTAELIHGLLTHKVGVKVLDGTEDWGQNTTYKRFTTQFSGMVSASPRSLPFLSTHFVTAYSATTEAGYIYNGANNTTIMITHDAADVTAFKAWLAAQYKAGTPVMVFYPIAEETTESVTAHHLVTHEGTNTVSVVAEVSPVELECVYYGTDEEE